MKKFIPLFFLFIFTFLAFKPFFIDGKLPIPADTLVGLYHPWRDQQSANYPNGVPFDNFLITDPIRQQYPWRKLAVESFKNNEWPNWNPYQLSGTPLLANLQTAALAPLNVLYFVLPFETSWSIQIILQVLLGGFFMYLYLRSLKLDIWAITLGTLSWVGSGFFVGWLEWNTLVQVALWLPLSLYLVDKVFFSKKKIIFSGLFALSLAASFLSGHLQIFSYVLVFVVVYSLARFIQTKKIKSLLLLLLAGIVFVILTSPQWMPMLTLFGESSRSLSPNSWQNPGWFLPVQNLAQFIAPDFFGNPATLNYFGVWNYLEFVGYIGLVGLFFALLALIGRRDKKTLFFGVIVVVSLVFMLPTFFAKLPFIFNFPLLSQAQPTRLIVLVDFSLSVLGALGLDHLLKNKDKKSALISLGIMFFALLFLWGIALRNDFPVSLRNLVLPSGTFLILALLVFGLVLGGTRKKMVLLISICLIFVAFFDIYRFFGKFESFSNPEWLYPKNKTLTFLMKNTSSNEGPTRIATLDDRILPPNTNLPYKLQSVDGYDSFFLTGYASLVSKYEKNYSWNRILTPKNLTTPLFDTLGVKYVLSLDAVKNPGYKLVYEEGQTKVYENISRNPRVKVSSGKAKIISYQPNEVIITVNTPKASKLVLYDPYYSSWKAAVDGKETDILLTEQAFRGIMVPQGKHTVRFFF